ncbi:MAG TPA: hypothetical protein VLI69_07090 [Gammaproteobacteria bacterium]|nr:hypothetical protein [Gammaproteobacteria bacterium]
MATAELLKNYETVEAAITAIMPASLASVVMDYYRETPRPN